MDTRDAKLSGDFHMQCGVIDIDNVFTVELDLIHCEVEDRRIRLQSADEAGAYEEVDQGHQVEHPDPVLCDLAPLVAQRHGLEVVAGLQLSRQRQHIRKRLRLLEDELGELLIREASICVEHHALQVFVESKLPLFVEMKDEFVTLPQVLVVQPELLGSTPS